MVFENRVLRRNFGPKREEVTGFWRKLLNELHNLYFSPYNIKIIKCRGMNGTCKICGDVRNTYRILVGNPEGNRSIGRPRVDEKIILK
jgi:hypothetical protein